MENLISLLEYAQQQGIDVDWFSLRRAESLSVPLGSDTYGVAIDPFKVCSAADRYCKLAHEVGHCMTGAFYNRYSKFDLRQRHENSADKWAIQRRIPIEALDDAVASGYTEPWSLAEYFNVTENFMRKAVCLYQHGNLAVDYYCP